jgi:outer membrane receptor protein involved in Fe transport
MLKLRSKTLAAVVAAMLAGTVHAEEAASRAFNINAQSLNAALSEFARQSQQEILFTPEIVAKKYSSGVRGTLNPIEALAVLLKDTGLTFATTPQGAILLQLEKTTHSAKASLIRVAQADAGDDATGTERTTPGADPSSITEGTFRVPEVLVTGARLLNTDIRRSQDDPQPYVIFERAVIEQSGAVDINDFLKTRLTMSATGGTSAQTTNVAGAVSGVNLRGLGENQTLILIDGRRAAKTSSGFSPGQPDLNGIPLAAIERIEVLPTTASAIYGGAATGGVVNVVLRRDYSGLEVSATYDNSFDSDSSSRRIDIASGFNFFEGRTNVLLSGSYSESNPLELHDRDFIQRGRQRISANNPNWQRTLTFPVSGAAANVLSSNGQNLVLDDGTPLNARFTSAPLGYAGVASDGGHALVANAGQYNLDLSNAANFNAGNGSFGPTPSVKAISGTIRHEFTQRLHGFFEASHSENTSRGPGSAAYYGTLAADAPTNPFQQPITVVGATGQFNTTDIMESKYDRLGAGLIVQLPAQWTMSADYTFTRAELSYQTGLWVNARVNAALADGSLDLLRDADASGDDLSGYIEGPQTVGIPVTSTTRNPALRVSGPIGFGFKAGAPQLSFLLEQQDVKYGSGDQLVRNRTIGAHFPERTQKIDSAYMEVRVPLLSANNGLAWARSLELQLAARWDRYRSRNANYVSYNPPAAPGPAIYITNDADDVNPLVALHFQPIESLALRASWGTGFIPPEINQLTAPRQSIANGSYIDPRRGYTGSPGPWTAISGGNPNLQPESSISWSAGLIWTPRALEGLRVSLDYTSIEKEDNIATLSDQQIIDNEAYFPGRVTRGPNLPTDPAGWAGPITVIDSTTINSAWAKLEAFDLQMSYDLPRTRFGQFGMFAFATYQPTYDTRLAQALPVSELAGVAAFSLSIPVKFKGNFGLTWGAGNWNAGWTSRYIGSYYVANPAAASSAVVFVNQGDGGRVDRQIYHDVFAKYRFDEAAHAGLVSQLLGGLEIQAGVRNLFNSKPPYDTVNGYQFYSWLGDPRLATYYLTVKQSF